jgi:hypothetical protein
MAALGIAPEDDDGDAAIPKYKANKPPTKAEPMAKAKANQLNTVRELWTARTSEGGDGWHEEFCNEFKIGSSKQIISMDMDTLKKMAKWLSDE